MLEDSASKHILLILLTLHLPSIRVSLATEIRDTKKLAPSDESNRQCLFEGIHMSYLTHTIHVLYGIFTYMNGGFLW